MRSSKSVLNFVRLVKDFPVTAAVVAQPGTEAWTPVSLGHGDMARHQDPSLAVSTLAKAVVACVGEMKTGTFIRHRLVTTTTEGAGSGLFIISLHRSLVERLRTILPGATMRILCKTNNSGGPEAGSGTNVFGTRLGLTSPDGAILEEWGCYRISPLSILGGKRIICYDIILEWPEQVKPQPIKMNRASFAEALLGMDSSKDLTLVAGGAGGAEIKCHRIVVAAHSGVLAGLVLPKAAGKKESKPVPVEVGEISEDGLTRLVRYFYGMELITEDLSCTVALELLKTAHKYKIKELVSSLIKMFLDMEGDGFTPTEVLELYFHAKILEESEEWKGLMDHSLLMMLNFGPAIRECERYKEISQTNPQAAEQLGWKLYELLDKKRKENVILPAKRRLGEGNN